MAGIFLRVALYVSYLMPPTFSMILFSPSIINFHSPAISHRGRSNLLCNKITYFIFSSKILKIISNICFTIIFGLKRGGLFGFILTTHTSQSFRRYFLR